MRHGQAAATIMRNGPDAVEYVPATHGWHTLELTSPVTPGGRINQDCPDYSTSPTQQPNCCRRCRALRKSVTTIALNPHDHQGTTDSLIARSYLPESKVGTRNIANISSANLACNPSTQSPDQCSANSAIGESQPSHCNPAEHRTCRA